MKITTVSYERLATMPGYNNETVRADGVVEDGETPEQAFVSVKAWVLQRVGKAYEVSNVEQELEHLRYEKARMEQDMELAQRRLTFIRELLAKHHVTVDDLEEENIPF